MDKEKKEYLGDGLYARDAGFLFELSCERENGTNWVGLEDEVLTAFLRFIERSRGVNIKVTRVEKE